MKRKEIEKKVKDALVRVLGRNEEEINSDKKLIEDLGMDSFASLELVFELEDALGIKISTEDSKCFTTVEDVYKYIENIVSTHKGAAYAHE